MRLTLISKSIVAAMFLAVALLGETYAQDYNGFQTNLDDLEERLGESNIKGPLEFKGHVEELTTKIKGAIVVLYESPDGSHEGLVEVKKMVTKGKGEFEFKLAINKFYVLSVQKEGYTTKTVDFDTDVSLARPEHSKVPTFEFRVDMVKDLDGLAFRGSVASVFYQIKRNEFDYELDYSKEELEEEERLLREQEEKLRLAALAAQKKFEIEQAAKLLLEKDNASAQEIITASIQVGGGDEKKIKSGFLKVFAPVDTLKEKKVDIMYSALQEEQNQAKAAGAEINYQKILDAAKKFETEIEEEVRKEEEEKVQTLRAVVSEVKAKEKDAMVLAQKALELEKREKLVAAINKAEIEKKKEELEFQDKVYNAIFVSNGESQRAIDNIVKTYPKSDSYREEKAKAIYVEYEKARIAGQKPAEIDYKTLFKAAEIAEQEAIEKELEKDVRKSQVRTEAFLAKVEEQKEQEQKVIAFKIEQGLTAVSNDKESQLLVFTNALPITAPFRQEKALAMYEAYTQQKQHQQQLGGKGTFKLDFEELFLAAEEAEADAKEQAIKEKLVGKRTALVENEEKRAEVRLEKIELAEVAAKQAKALQSVKIKAAKIKKAAKLEHAIKMGGGSRERTIREIAKRLPSTGEKEIDLVRAEGMYDEYLVQKKKIQQSGNVASPVDFDLLFKAAEKKELEHLERQFVEKQAKEEERLAAYEEKRIEKTIEIVQVKNQEAEKAKEESKVKYETTVKKVEVARQERLEVEKKLNEALEKEIEVAEAKRALVGQAVISNELSNLKRSREERLEQEAKMAELAAAKEEAENRRIEAQAKMEAEQMLASVEKAKMEAVVASRKAEEAKKAEEAQKAVKEERAKREAELVALREEIEFKKNEEIRLAQINQAKQEVELAKGNAEIQRFEDEKRRPEIEAKVKREAVLFAQNLELERQKEERAKRAEEEKATRLAELAARKEETQRAREAREKQLAAVKAKEQSELASIRAEEQRLKEEQQEALARQKAMQEAELAVRNAELALLDHQQVSLEAEDKAIQDARLAASEAEKERARLEQERLALEQRSPEQKRYDARIAEQQRLKEERERLAI
ncbi:hypothetical protein ACFLR1_01540, partial [Bacteroidota bacterium]